MTVYLAIVSSFLCVQPINGNIISDCEMTTDRRIKSFDSWEDACLEAKDKRVWRMEFQPNGNRFVKPGYTLTAFRCESEPKYRLVEEKP